MAFQIIETRQEGQLLKMICYQGGQKLLYGRRGIRTPDPEGTSVCLVCLVMAQQADKRGIRTLVPEGTST